MSEFSDFKYRYAGLSLPELLSILDNPRDYLPEARAAAQDELNSRHPSEDELSSARAALEEKKQNAGSGKRKADEVTEKWKAALQSVAETIDPVRRPGDQPGKIIAFIAIIACLALLITLSRFKLNILWPLQDVKSNPVVLIFVVIDLLPAAATLPFILGKKSGWVLMAIFFIGRMVTAFADFVFITNHLTSGSPGILYIQNEGELWNVFFAGIISAVCLYVLNKKNTLDIYKVTADERTMTIAAAVVSTLAAAFVFLYI